MGAAESSSAQTEGKIDGRPATLFYKATEGDDEGGLGYVEGYKVCMYCHTVPLTQPDCL